MSIHASIKARRVSLGWSQTRLAETVSELEGLKKPLTYATVQQWENGASAPKRTRLEFVAQALSCTPADLTGHQATEPTSPLDWRTLAMLIADQCPDPKLREALNTFCGQVDSEASRLAQKLKNRE